MRNLWTRLSRPPIRLIDCVSRLVNLTFASKTETYYPSLLFVCKRKADMKYLELEKETEYWLEKPPHYHIVAFVD